MKKNLRDIKGFVFDFDGVFYTDKGISGKFGTLCDATVAKIAPRLLKQYGMTAQLARDLAYEGYKRYGLSMAGIFAWITEQGINLTNYRDELFLEYNKHLRAEMERIAPHIFNGRRDLRSAFEISRGHVQNGVATHSCSRNWAFPLLDSMGIRQHFEEAAIIGLADGDYILKHTEPRLIELACAGMGLPPDEIAFVEDSPRNLETFKDKYPNAITIHIHHGCPLDPLPTYIDFQFYNILEMKRAWAESYKETEKIISANSMPLGSGLIKSTI